MAFQARLRELREAAALTQSDLAERAGLSIGGVTQLEQGRRKPAWETVEKLAAALGVGVEAFSAPATGSAPAPKRGRPRKPVAGAPDGLAAATDAQAGGKGKRPKK
jgi:transcriptional regulator with XRE-family HTH domain